MGAIKTVGIFSLLVLLIASCGDRGGSGMSGSGGNSPSNGGGNPSAPATNNVSGIITFNGVPLVGVKVTAYNTNSNTIFASVMTDATGSYSITGLIAVLSTRFDQSYQLWAEKSGYSFYPSVGSGAKVERFDYTGQYGTSAGIYKTVINYTSNESGSLTGANFIAYNGTTPLVSIAATGQGTTYAAGDDGSMKKGVAWPSARFVDNSNGTVTDNLTGLIWLKDSGCLSPGLWNAALASANQLANGACGLTDGSTAGQWRLPNINELESLVDVSQINPAIPAGHPFKNVSNGIYWSSTTYVGLPTEAWTIRFSDGRYMNDYTSNVKATSANYVWAVRGGAAGGVVKLQATGQYVNLGAGDDAAAGAGVPLTYPRMIDNGDGTVTDTMTGYVWLKKGDCINMAWANALAAVNGLASGACGLTDGSAAGSWRMPNRNELMSLSDRALGNHADYFDTNYSNSLGVGNQAPVFSTFVVSVYYWTSSTDAADVSKAWSVFSCDFGVYDIAKNSTGYALAIRR